MTIQPVSFNVQTHSVAPPPPSLPAWLSGVPLLKWVQPPHSSLTQMPATEIAKLYSAGYCKVDGSQLLGLDGRGGTYGATHGDVYQGIFADSGGTFRKSGSTLILFGGGGAGGWAGNDIRALRLEDDDPKWEIHVPPTNSPVSGTVYFQAPGPWWRNAPGYPHPYMQDGVSPNARHSYRGPQFHDGMDTFFAVGCDNVWESDSGIFPIVDACNWGTRLWTPPASNVDTTTVSGWKNAPVNHSTNNNLRLKDPTTEHIYWGVGNAIYEFDPTTNTWPRRCYFNANRSDVQYGCHAINPNYNGNGATGLMFVLGLYGGVFRPYVYEMHAGADSWVLTAVGTSAPWWSNIAAGGPSPWMTGGSYGGSMENGFIYCPDRNSFMMYQNDGYVWEITQSTPGDLTKWAINRMDQLSAPLTGSAPAANGGVIPGGTDGTYVRCLGHMQYVPNLKGVALFVQGSWNCFFFRTG